MYYLIIKFSIKNNQNNNNNIIINLSIYKFNKVNK